ncbi:RICIN domain-containing protein [Streptomyces roseoverticillatus]|uniref:RICIN domain-containing protein n=1 Tax=Streptomyces roseoverticillatus TaxID=66429 RepID=UPI001F26D52D|nr:RICIN domain-containing protein [Streptomyces roseoverticillatus]
MIAATAATAVVLAGSAALGGVFDHESPRPQAVTAQTAADGPAPAPAHDKTPEPVTRIPDDDRPHGLVYQGLAPAPKGDRCAGVLRTTDGRCTHGPDKPPRGVNIAKDTPPVVKTRDVADTPGTTGTSGATDDDKPSEKPSEKPSGTSSPGTPASVDARQAGTAAAKTPQAAPKQPVAGGKSAASGQAVQCDGDGTTGNRVQVVYAHGPGNDRYAEYLASFRKWAADADTIYYASAQETGGVRHIRFVTGADCMPSVLNVEVTDSALSEFSALNSALAAKGFDRRDRKYMIFADAKVYCGIGTFNGDERPGAANLSNFGPSYGRTDAGCWSGSTAAHELGHNLGAVNNSAPNSSRAAHCTDEWDVMCYSDAPYYPAMRTICPDRGHDERLDCNHDDYFHTNPQPGSYLATHWNVANNQFLMTGNGTKPDPGPTPTPTPTPNPTGSTGPSPSTGPVPVVGQLTSDSAVVSWPAAPSAAWYQLLLNGSHLAWIQPNSARIYNLRPDTEYTVAVAVRDAAGHDSRAGRAVKFRTPAVGSTTKAGTRYTLTNGYSGLAAELWGGKTADGTVLVGSQPNGFTPQQWYVDDAGSGHVRLRSAASGKCLQLGGEAKAGQWVAQRPCSGSGAQQWRLAKAGDGLRLTAGDGSLALGVSKQPYYGGRLLELQDTDGSGFQLWTLQKAA